MIRGLNHAVLYVRDADRHRRFYEDVLGFATVTAMEGRAAFMRAPDSTNHHDIAFFTIGADAGAPSAGRTTVGLYHLAWEVATLDQLVELRRRLTEAGSLVGESDHHTSKSLYCHDPDGIEFEVLWATPSEFWGAGEHDAVVQPLDLAADLARCGGTRTSLGPPPDRTTPST